MAGHGKVDSEARGEDICLFVRVVEIVAWHRRLSYLQIFRGESVKTFNTIMIGISSLKTSKSHV